MPSLPVPPAPQRRRDLTGYRAAAAAHPDLAFLLRGAAEAMARAYAAERCHAIDLERGARRAAHRDASAPHLAAARLKLRLARAVAAAGLTQERFDAAAARHPLHWQVLAVGWALDDLRLDLGRLAERAEAGAGLRAAFGGAATTLEAAGEALAVAMTHSVLDALEAQWGCSSDGGSGCGGGRRAGA
jgi:hypothetical protein